ncbi:MAG: hypothetical protein LUE92_03735 [Clostridiales bacterium]|nr:hypothetical protein [Clostridiales bacterium]
MADNKYQWIDFYMELATNLLAYREDRPALIKKIKQVYINIGLKLPKLESDNNPTDMDPFSVFGLFNKGISNANRILIIKGIADEFSITAAIPDTFEGIPVLNNLKATFYWFKEDRGEHDIDHLWDLYVAAIAFAEKDDAVHKNAFCDAYNIVLKQHGIRWNITMGLYWIRPYVFVNLDSRNRWYMTEPGNMPTDYVAKVKPMLAKNLSAEQYLEIVGLCRQALDSRKYVYSTFPELSYYAWVISEQVNQEQKAAETGEKKEYFQCGTYPLDKADRAGAP